MALAVYASNARAQRLLPPDPSKTIGGVVSFAGFVDAEGRDGESLMRPDASGRALPWIVSPIYTRCPHTCSPLTTGLRTALEKSDLQGTEYRVVSFSFDPDETAEGLRAFRAKLQLPDTWLTVRAARPEALERVLASLDFRTIKNADGQYDHPNLVAILAPDLRLTEYLFGIRFVPTQLAAAVRRAPNGPSPLAGWHGYLFAVAGTGLMLSAFVFVSVLLRRRARRATERTRAAC